MEKYTIDIISEGNDGYTDFDFLKTNYDPLSESVSRKIFELGLRQMSLGLFKNWNAIYDVGNTSYIWSFQKADTGIRYAREVRTMNMGVEE